MRAVLALVVALLLVAPAVARADDDRADTIAAARRLADDVRYPEARAALIAALAQGGHDPDGLVAIYRLLGEVAVGLGDAAAARDAFVHMLVIAPGAGLPVGSSPKIVAALDEARGQLAGKPGLAVRAEATERGVVLRVDGDPLGMVRGAQATYRRPDGAYRRVEGAGATRVELVMPAEAPPRIEVAALDEHGNALRMVTVDRPVVRSSTPVAAPATTPRWYARWSTWGAATVLASAVTAGLAVQAGRTSADLDALIDDSGAHTYVEARAAEDRARRWALATNVSLAVSAGLAVVTVIALVRGSGDDERADAVSIRPAVGAHHLGVALCGGF